MQRDPIGARTGLNLYEYCDGRPLLFADPLGLTGGRITNCTDMVLQYKVTGKGWQDLAPGETTPKGVDADGIAGFSAKDSSRCPMCGARKVFKVTDNFHAFVYGSEGEIEIEVHETADTRRLDHLIKGKIGGWRNNSVFGRHPKGYKRCNCKMPKPKDEFNKPRK